jgi:heat shock protein HtpX
MTRIVLFVLANLAVMLVLSVGASLLGIRGHSMNSLLVYCALFGMGGSFISLLMSKKLAKWSTGARVLTGNEGGYEQWLVETVADLAQRAGIGMPEVAFYEGEPNAFATGAFRDEALVAVSTGLAQSMTHEEVRAVLAHEIAHIANGDMVTMSLLQGVLNTFVMVAARVLAGNDRRAANHFVVFILEMVFGLLTSLIVMAFSRHREYRADWGAAELLGSAVPMQRALYRLGHASSDLPQEVAAFGISGGAGMADLLRSHPQIEDRIAALDQFGR